MKNELKPCPDPERLAQIIAHRAVGGAEHDPMNGKFHGNCAVCLVPWPCEYAGTPPEKSDLESEQKRWQDRIEKITAPYGVDGSGCDSGDPLDFTAAEISLALNKVDDVLYDTLKMLESGQDVKHVIAFLKRPLKTKPAPTTEVKP